MYIDLCHMYIYVLNNLYLLCICLIFSTIFISYDPRCDRELTFRLQKQNAALVAKMSRLHEHTKMLLFRLAESDPAEVCALLLVVCFKIDY